MKIVTARQAADLIEDGWRIIAGGFGCCGNPDSLTEAIRERFDETEHPKGIRLFFASGTGDKAGRGLDRLAVPGLVTEAIGGFWGFCPKLTDMALNDRLEGHNWPQGVMSKLFSAIGAGESAYETSIGLETFIDPRLEGGVIGTHTPLVSLQQTAAGDRLSFPALRPDCCILRGTTSDGRGNISMEHETSWMDAVAQAVAVKNRGGIVIVQVEALIDRHTSLGSVKIPGMLVDYVVISNHSHPMTYGQPRNISLVRPGGGRRRLHEPDVAVTKTSAKDLIVRRAFNELRKYRGRHINLGIGIPAQLGAYATSQGFDDYWLTIESGTVGGIPQEGLSFGASAFAEAIMDQQTLFDFYHGGGIEAAFLGFGELDAEGNINVSRFGTRLPGAGGFINITQSARNLIFCGTFSTSGLQVEQSDERLRIIREGDIPKLVDRVQQITFSASRARQIGQKVLYITERAVFRLAEDGLEVVERCPGITHADLIRNLSNSGKARITDACGDSGQSVGIFSEMETSNVA